MAFVGYNRVNNIEAILTSETQPIAVLFCSTNINHVSIIQVERLLNYNWIFMTFGTGDKIYFSAQNIVFLIVNHLDIFMPFVTCCTKFSVCSSLFNCCIFSCATHLYAIVHISTFHFSTPSWSYRWFSRKQGNANWTKRECKRINGTNTCVSKTDMVVCSDARVWCSRIRKQMGKCDNNFSFLFATHFRLDWI